ncbi:C4-type zinc ribbon domain-containing protein [Candidatus Aminicenantes bacterium AC-335-K20]|nr:C4-type zinc ribbon domain-containing protein [SCandidatus Aminicenantes bacterium Aminicenantia_JdfR_composite]MCP2597769.1 C4-type zinc ribbon domain-containing protein [Candidatus Aminicenantes bacterium AC-335-L06]MCP2605749.1 C4-type zinc ribbon domain-containing protein [Candidatus Aminicenantes bacterium AC-335-O07]MCP2619031.1 C4-type zinc ribbon domain-containing protein [Candidatus Aminicenantes bacterium AC-335-A11]MCP2619545.1 C4-type zinc ribbon domain-containing protein [Candid
MEQEFESLISLQEIDKKLISLKKELNQIPLKLKEIEDKRKKNQEELSKAKEKLIANQKKRKELELEVQSLKEKVSKYKKQLYEVKTNKEYASMLKEIEFTEGEIEKLEEKIIEELLNADEIQAEIKKAEEINQRENNKLQEEEQKIKSKREKILNEIEELNKERKELIPKVPKNYLELYEKIFSKKNGIVLSPVSDEFCSVCNMRIRPQMLNELKSNKDLIFCENCGRILYWVGKPASEKKKKRA